MTDPAFKFPQVWRTNIAVDHRLPGGVVSTTEYMYAKDVNGIYYIDANLPAPQSAFTGVDARPRWTSSRLNTTPGNFVNNAYVLKNGSEGNSWNFSQSFQRNFRLGLNLRGAWSYGESDDAGRSGIDRGHDVRARHAPRRSQQRRRRHVVVVAGPSRVRAPQLQQGVLQLRRHHRVGVLGDAAEHEHLIDPSQLHVRG